MAFTVRSLMFCWGDKTTAFEEQDSTVQEYK